MRNSQNAFLSHLTMLHLYLQLYGDIISFVVTVGAIRQLSPTGATLMGRFL